MLSFHSLQHFPRAQLPLGEMLKPGHSQRKHATANTASFISWLPPAWLVATGVLYFMYLLYSRLTDLLSNICSRLLPLCSLCFPKKKQAASSCDGPGDKPLHGTGSLLLPSSPLSAQGVRAFPDERGRAKLGSFQRACGLPSHSPWQFDCSTWRTPSSGHSGLVDHGCRHILLGRALVPIQINQVISTVSFPSALFAAEICLSLSWGSSQRGQGEQDIIMACLSWKKAHSAFLLLPEDPKSEPRCCPCSNNSIYDKGENERRG